MVIWENWLSQLEATPPDDPVWGEFDAFSAAATQIATAKRHQKEYARTALEETLVCLQEQDGEALARLGWGDLSVWQSADCSSTQALRAVAHLKQLQELLERYHATTQQVPATPQEFQELRRSRNDLEDEIFGIGSMLDQFFADPQANHSLEITRAAIEPEVAPIPEAVEEAIPAEVETPAVQESAVPESLTEALEITESVTSTAQPIASEVEVAQPEIAVAEPVVEQAPVFALSSSQHSNNGYIAQPSSEAISEEAKTVPTARAPVLEATEEEVVSQAVAVKAIVSPVAEPEPVATEDKPTEEIIPAEQVTLAPPPQLAVPDKLEDAPPGDEAASQARHLRIFISSPGDVGQERVVAMRVVERLQAEFASYVELEPILWEHEPLRATGHFQEQILAPSLADIMVCILWSRLGTRLPAQFQREDGSRYASGTEWEFEDALNSYKQRGTPDLVVYRKSAEPHASMSDEKALLDRLAQKRALDSFIDRWFGNPQESFKAAFHQFSSPDEFEQVLESHLRKLISERLPSHITEDGSAATIRWHKGSPFRGLEAFDPEHAPVFFGRTRAISEVSANLIHQATLGCAFIVIFGMSGSGKSSMVKAGLLPTLTQPGVVEGVGLWRWALTMPSETRDPILGLAYALLQDNALPELKAQGLDASELAGLLREAPQRVIGPLRAALKTTAETTAKQENLHQIPLARLAIVVDQLEEVFTQEGLDPEERRRFFIVLQTLARSGIVWVMATMRSDFFVRCAEIPEMMELKEGQGQYHLLPPTFAELSQILTQPARSAGLRFEVDPQTGERLSDVLQGAAGKDPGALPLLEFTLDQLFHKRTAQGVLTFEAYKALGGVEGALGRRAEEVFLGLPLTVQDELPAVLRALVTVNEEGSGSEIHVGARRASLDQISQNSARRQLVEAFVAARLLVSDRIESGSESEGAAPGAVVRLAHEALLRHWPRLQKWLSDDLEFLRTRARVMNSAVQWGESKLPEYLLRQGRPLAEAEDLLLRRQSELEPATIRYIQESKRAVRRARNLRLSVITCVIVAFLGVISGFGVFSFKQWKKNERQKELALTAVNKWTYDVPEKLANIAATRPALKTIFQENIKLLDDIEELDPQTNGLKREKAANLDRMGDTWMLLGDSSQAKKSYEDSLAILTGLEASDSTPERKRDLATSLEKIGDQRQLAGDTKGAGQAFQQSLDLRSELVNSTQSPEINRELSVSYEKLGSLQRSLQDYANCQVNYKKAYDIRNALVQKHDDAQSQRDVFVSAVDIGGAYLDEGKVNSAQKTFKRALPLALKRAATKDPEARRDLAALYDSLGDVQVKQGKAAPALAYFKQSMAITQDLARNQNDAQAQRDLLTSWERIGNISLSSGDARGALASFAKALPLALNLARDRDNLEAQQSLMDSYIEIGDVQLQMGGLTFAHAAYTHALEQYGQITQTWPKDDHSRSQAANAYGQMAYLKLQFRKPQEAVDAATKGLELAPDQAWIAVNLVEAYVFTNQLPKAEALYLKNRGAKIQGVLFKQVVITDIQQIATAGLTHPDFAKLTEWLKQN